MSFDRPVLQRFVHGSGICKAASVQAACSVRWQSQDWVFTELARLLFTTLGDYKLKGLIPNAFLLEILQHSTIWPLLHVTCHG